VVGVLGADEPAGNLLRVLSADSGEVLSSFRFSERSTVAPTWEKGIQHARFLPDGSLVTDGVGGVLRWDLATGEATPLVEAEVAWLETSRDGKVAVIAAQAWRDGGPRETELVIVDPVSGSRFTVTSHGDDDSLTASFDPSGEILVSTDWSGVVRAGPAGGEEPHLLLAHDTHAAAAVSPDGEWIFSAAGQELLMWPMPDLSEPPLHTLPLDELLSELRAMTNVRVVEDSESAEGWSLEVGPFREP
jgi:hypothetical protein